MVYAGNGAGGLSPAAGIGLPAPFGIVAGDWDRDGKQDLATANNSGPAVTTVDGNGGFGFAMSGAYGVCPSSYGIAAGDVDADGALDLAVCDWSGNRVVIMAGDGAGAFAPAADPTMAGMPIAPVLADFDLDGRLDIAVADYSGAAAARLNTSAVPTGIHFDAPVGVLVEAGSYAAATGDVNNDGKPDAVVTCTDGYVRTLLGDGSGTLTPSAAIHTGDCGCDVRLADVDCDGRLDLITPGYSGGLYVARGDGSGGFGSLATYGTNSYPYFVDVGDLNQDGYPDIVVSCYNSAAVSVYLNDRSGGFAAKADYAVPPGPPG